MCPCRDSVVKKVTVRKMRVKKRVERLKKVTVAGKKVNKMTLELSRREKTVKESDGEVTENG